MLEFAWGFLWWRRYLSNPIHSTTVYVSEYVKNFDGARVEWGGFWSGFVRITRDSTFTKCDRKERKEEENLIPLLLTTNFNVEWRKFEYFPLGTRVSTSTKEFLCLIWEKKRTEKLMKFGKNVKETNFLFVGFKGFFWGVKNRKNRKKISVEFVEGFCKSKFDFRVELSLKLFRLNWGFCGAFAGFTFF